jgi:hypothetical protein
VRKFVKGWKQKLSLLKHENGSKLFGDSTLPVEVPVTLRQDIVAKHKLLWRIDRLLRGLKNLEKATLKGQPADAEFDSEMEAYKLVQLSGLAAKLIADNWEHWEGA